jgi:NADPH:quinone reductase-like Zn-dependent oxidoreductase
VPFDGARAEEQLRADLRVRVALAGKLGDLRLLCGEVAAGLSRAFARAFAAEGELRIRVLVSGVNPTYSKPRSGTFAGALTETRVPNHDGGGVVDKLGAGVSGFSVGDRVWVTLAGEGRPAGGTAQEYAVVPAERVFPPPDAARGTISIYANNGAAAFTLDVGRNMGLNSRYQFVLLYTVGWALITAAAADINQAIEDGAFRVGEHAGLPVYRFKLEDTAAAHAAVESGAVGKVLVTVGDEALT